MHVVDVMNAANSVRCLLELSADELEETCDMCREHGDALTRWGRLDRSSIARLAHLGLYRIEHFAKRNHQLSGLSPVASVKTSESFILVFKSAIVTSLSHRIRRRKGNSVGKEKGEWREEEP